MERLVPAVLHSLEGDLCLPWVPLAPEGRALPALPALAHGALFISSHSCARLWAEHTRPGSSGEREQQPFLRDTQHSCPSLRRSRRFLR